MVRVSHEQAHEFVRQVASLRFKNAFNPYSDSCLEFDLTDAPQLRRANLTAVVEASIRNGVDSIWVGRDLGYRGGRRTGLALTDEAHLDANAQLLGTPPLHRSTRGPVMAERTASIVWRTLEMVGKPVFLWNVFPLHPYSPGDQLSNRAHSKAERHACRPLLKWLLDVLRPRTVVAIGKDAETALLEIDIAAIRVRHPSYGGQSAFVSGIESIYGLGMETGEPHGQAVLF